LAIDLNFSNQSGYYRYYCYC